MDKLKKLGKYFTKGLQVGFLATAFIAGNVSCSNAAGGDSIEFNGGYVGDGDQTSKWPSYYINTEFGGQRFTELTAKLYVDNNRDASFDKYYTNAKKFMNAKVDELANLVNNSDIGPFYGQIKTLLQNYSKANTIKNNIENNYNALAPIFKAMRNTLVNNEDFNRFNVSYYKLAADAFNQSVGKLAEGENKKNFTTNTELIDDSSNFFASELNDAKLSYADATNKNNAVDRMNGYLNTIATKTNTNLDVLKKVVELALYNESLYGLNDFTVVCGVFNQGLTTTKRRLDIFQTAIRNATYSLANTQNLDDRTM